MPDLSGIIQWIEQYPRTGWLLLLLYILLGVLRHRLINAEPGAFRGLFNFRRRQLEQMLKQPYLNKKAARLIKRELRQRSLYRLTGLYNYRLQDLAVMLCDSYNLRAGYLKPWRNWLSEKNGLIIFSRKWHRFRWRLFVTVQLINLILLVVTIGLVVSHEPATLRAPLIFIYLIAWWIPWLVITAVPFPAWTQEMEAYVENFNAEQGTE